MDSNGISFKIVKLIAIVNEKLGFEPMSSSEIMTLNIIIRKLAHGFQFFIFSIVLSFIMPQLKIKKENVVFYILLLIMAFAVVDEVHQLFVEGRTPSIFDVVIDFVGGVVGVAVINIFSNVKKSSMISQR